MKTVEAFIYVIAILVGIGIVLCAITGVIYAINYILTEWRDADKRMKEEKSRITNYDKYKNEIRNF